MPQPLPDTVVATLRTDPCAALAAIMIISNAHAELLAWAQRAISGCPPPSAVGGKEGAKANGAGGSNGVAESDGASGPAPRIKSGGGGRAKGRHTSREAAAKHDQALLALMRANPGASVTEIIRMNRRPRNSTVLSLDRLEKAGLIEHAGRGKWTRGRTLICSTGPRRRSRRAGLSPCRPTIRPATRPTGGCATS